MRILIAGIVVLLAGALFLVTTPVRRDSARLDSLRERVFAHPLPPQTNADFPGEGDATIGKITGGSGDYCEYMVRMTLRTTLTADQIREHYRKAAILGTNLKDKAQISLWFEEVADGARERRAIVEVSDTHDSDWDWRCS